MRGVADFGGHPHVYEAVFDTAQDEYTDRFALMEVGPALLALVLERWEIWLRWKESLQGGSVPLESHPALPQDSVRDDELRRLIGDRLSPVPDKSIVTRAEFRRVGAGPADFEVRWTEVTGSQRGNP